ncbi:unnamed protein product, partial [Effrenium voratum]
MSLASPLLAGASEGTAPKGANLSNGESPQHVEVFVQNSEWSALDSSDSGDEPDDRRDRYARIARAQQRTKAAQHWAEAAKMATARRSRKAPGRAYSLVSAPSLQLSLVQTLGCFWIDTWLSLFALIYLVYIHDLPHALCLLPSQLLVAVIQAYLALHDSELERRRVWLSAMSCGACYALCFDLVIAVVCGLFCAYTLVVICRICAEGVPDKVQNFKTPTGGPFESVDWMFSRRSFGGGDVGSFDCLIRFMTGAPRVVCFLHLLSGARLWDRSSWMFLIALAFNVSNMLQAMVLFDFKVSAFIRREYNNLHGKKFFKGRHCLLRLLELLLRAQVLVLLASSLSYFYGFRSAASVLFLDYLVGLVALGVLAGCSPKTLIISLSLYMVDVSRYVDQQGLVTPARRLSLWIACQRAALLMCTLVLAWPFWGPNGCCCMLAFWGAQAVMSFSRAGARPSDLHAAAKRGDLRQLHERLKEGYDVSRRQCTPLQQTPLHLAIAFGHLACA